ncbi:hypothetical protein [Hoeflea poritis]|uniref:DUF5655 domain-containing protein n=1 Tax=Hoeflea poritis TaxID=2993659 RepID=A0ABT4VJ33_9HYPH|nr:hypothetical protein [Hoeflea poritis]MDA4844675.1 hypothetical protein [Hoeflea poritis]
MELSGRVRILDNAGFGVWKVEATPKDLQFLGKPLARAHGRSVISLQNWKLSEDKNFLTFPIDKASVLLLGDNEDCIAIDREASTDKLSSSKKKPDSFATQRSAMISQQNPTFGDQAFIAACEAEALPPKIVELGKKFLSRVRDFSNDRLREGKHRKWVTYPKNFLALTIQNRNQQFCVHVRKTSVLDSLTGSLDIRDDRPGYVRFWLQDESQLEAAVTASKGSFDV